LIKIPEKIRDKMDSSQPDDLILMKAGAAAIGAFLFKKGAVFVYDLIKTRTSTNDLESDQTQEEV
jgi:hypothetical protein